MGHDGPAQNKDDVTLRPTGAEERVGKSDIIKTIVEAGEMKRHHPKCCRGTNPSQCWQIRDVLSRR